MRDPWLSTRQAGTLSTSPGSRATRVLAALREDLKMDVVHRNDFRRIAVVADRTWIKWGTALAGFLTSAEMLGYQ